MKEFVQNINSNPAYLKVMEWGRLITVTGSVQLLVQVFGFASAILVIRLLPTKEYAFYTLANTMLANMVILADSGIANGVMSEGGKVWKDRNKLGAVIATGLVLRRQFAIYSLIVIVPILLFLLRHHGADWLTTILIIGSVTPTFFAIISGSLFEIAPKLHQKIVDLQRIQLGTAFGRVTLLGLSLITLPLTFVACLSAGLAQIWANRQLVKVSSIFAEDNVKSDPIVRTKILTMVKRLLPESIYTCTSGQITIWLISIFGSTAALAEAGALSRLSMVINLFSILFASLIVPRFARMNGSSQVLLKRYLQIQAGMLVLGVCIVSVISLFSTEVLSVLGPNYAGLGKEVVLMITGSSLYVIGQSSFYLCTSKGWVINPVISIPVSIATIVGGALLIDISSLQDIFTLNIAVASVQVFMHFLYGFIKIKKQIKKL